MYPRIAAKIYEEPWQVMPSRWEEIARAFQEVQAERVEQFMREHGKADDPVGPVIFDFWTDEQRPAIPQVEVLNGVALARVHGTTGKGLSRMDLACGGFDTGLFRQQLANVAGDAEVHSLVIDFNSPGGMAAGNLQVCQAIEGVRASGKRVIGFTQGLCASAAYFMASACDELHADPDAIVGSISTITSGVDSSEAYKQMGLERKVFATGKFKALGMPGKKWTAEEEANIWERLKLLDGEFKGYVRERRGLEDASMEGQWWYAKHAPKGVVDSVEFERLEDLLGAVMAGGGR